MATPLFKIYGGRTNFWQWDTGQKLIVLDENVTQVHFSNRDMSHSIKRDVYEYEGMRVCNVPDIILQLPRNLVAYAYIEDAKSGCTTKSIKFAVIKRPIPEGYVMDQGEQFDDISRRLEILENVIKDIELGNQKINKFDTIEDASRWAKENNTTGVIVVVRMDTRWIAHMVEDDYSVTPICDCDGQMVEVNIYDGGDADGYSEEEMSSVQFYDGGGAAGY